jgi:tetratricopeptide (TPR) repeat protein
VNTYQQISVSLMAQADTKRQLEQYTQAIALYEQARLYALKRFDKNLIALAQLKTAAIYIQTNELDKATRLITEVEQMQQFDHLDMAKAIKYIRAKLALSTGYNEQAIAWLGELESSFAPMSEKNIYYRIVRWSYAPQQVDYAAVESDMLALDDLLASKQLQNIEIYSFVLFAQLKWLAATDDEASFSVVLNKNLSHFSSLELTNKIAACYQLGSDFYRAIGQTAKADHYLSQVKKLNNIVNPH